VNCQELRVCYFFGENIEHLDNFTEKNGSINNSMHSMNTKQSVYKSVYFGCGFRFRIVNKSFPDDMSAIMFESIHPARQ